MWILTEDFNLYDQQGAYFRDAWKHKPTREQLLSAGVNEGELDHVLDGGGRIKYEDYWYNLFEHKNSQ